MIDRNFRPRAARAYVARSLAMGLAAMATACATDPYVQGVGLNPDEQALQKDKAPAGSIAAMLRVAKATRRAGDYPSAINVLKRAHDMDSNNMEVMAELGETLSAVGAYNEAREVYERAVEIKKDGVLQADARILRGYGNALVALSEPSLAITRYEQALKLSADAATYNGLGVARDINGDSAGAEEAYRKALEVDPSNANAAANLALSLALVGKYQDGINTLAPIIRLGRSTPRVRANMALIYGLAGRLADARVVLRMDFDERTVANNIAYYENLRGLSVTARREAVLGVRHIVPGQSAAMPEMKKPAPAKK